MSEHLFYSADGQCQPLRPPHKRGEGCTLRCSNNPPGNYATWAAYNTALMISHMRWKLEQARLGRGVKLA